MKYLNNNDLYFRIGDIDTGLTPTNANQSYNILITNKNDSTVVLKEYNGQIFYYSNDQKIYYDFLVDMMIGSDFTLPMTGDTTVIPIVTATITIGTYSLSEDVARFHKPEWLTETDYEILINPTEYPLMAWDYRFLYGITDLDYIHKYEIPKISVGMQYPAICYTGDLAIGNDRFRFGGHTATKNVPLKPNTVYTCDVVEYEEMQNAYVSLSRPGVSYIDILNLKYECNAPYILQWYDPIGFFQSQPFYGSESENYVHNTITNLQGAESKYQTQEKRNWILKSDYVKDQRMFQSLFVSPVIYLFDVEKQKYHRVLIENSDYNYTRSKKPFRFSVTLKADKSTIYR